MLPESCGQCLSVTDPYPLSLEVFPISTPLSTVDGPVVNSPPTSDWADLMKLIEEGSDPVASSFGPTQPANASLANSYSGNSVNPHYPSHTPQNPLSDSSWLTYPPTTTQPDYQPGLVTPASEPLDRSQIIYSNAPRTRVSFYPSPLQYNLLSNTLLTTISIGR